MSFCSRLASTSATPLFAGLLATFGLTTGLHAQSNENLPLGSASNSSLSQMTSEHDDYPEPEWGYADVTIVGQGLRCIVPDFGVGDSNVTADMLGLTKDIVPDTVLDSNGTIQGLYDQGTIYGVEFDLYSDDPGTKPTSAQRLGTVGAIQGYDLTNSYGTLARVYLYTQAQYANRLAAIQAENGVAPAQHSVWLDTAFRPSRATVPGPDAALAAGAPGASESAALAAGVVGTERSGLIAGRGMAETGVALGDEPRRGTR